MGMIQLPGSCVANLARLDRGEGICGASKPEILKFD